MYEQLTYDELTMITEQTMNQNLFLIDIARAVGVSENLVNEFIGSQNDAIDKHITKLQAN